VARFARLINIGRGITRCNQWRFRLCLHRARSNPILRQPVRAHEMSPISEKRPRYARSSSGDVPMGGIEPVPAKAGPPPFRPPHAWSRRNRIATMTITQHERCQRYIELLAVKPVVRLPPVAVTNRVRNNGRAMYDDSATGRRNARNPKSWMIHLNRMRCMFRRSGTPMRAPT